MLLAGDLPGLENKVTISKGTCFFKVLAADAWIDLGYIEEYKVNVTVQKVPVKRHRGGLAVKAKDIVKEIEGKGNFVAVSLTDEIIQYFLSSSAGASSTVTTDSVADESVTPIKLDKWSEIKDDGVHVKGLTAITVKKGAVVLTEGTDYKIDTVHGHLSILSTNGNTIVDDDATIVISCTYATVTKKRYGAGSQNQIKGHVKFMGDPVHGKKLVVLGYASLVPNGDIALIAEEPTKLTFDIEYEINSAYASLFLMDDEGTVTQ